jgi:radical SAM protein with 4Fe4S-binding SPASM domain
VRYYHRNEFFGGIVYDTVDKEYFYLDHLANRILKEPDRPLAAGELASFSASATEAGELREELGRKELFTRTRFRGNKPLPGVLSAPLRIFYEITYRCPEACEHCYTSSDQKQPDELTLAEKCSLVDQMANIGCFRMSIAGGEPLVDQDFFPLVEYALSRGIDISFSTSGIPITDRTAARLAELDIRTINVSLDGWDDESFGAVRGRGRLALVCRGVERLRRRYRRTIAAKCTILKTNVNHLEAIIDLAERLGFDTIKFNCVREAGRAGGKEWLLPSQDEYLIAMKRLSELYSSRSRRIKLTLPLNPYQKRDHHTSQYIEELGFGCYAGKESFCITPTGEIQPCSSFGKGVYADGNVRTRMLYDAWLNGDAMRLFRGMDGSDDCNSCPSYSGCKGGCYLRSYMATGDIRSTDPYCYEKRNVARYPRPPHLRLVT